MARKAIPKKIRFEVFKRDGFTCQYCGANPNKSPLQVDHIIAVAEGGSNDIDNLVTACQPCNIGKGATPLTSVPQSLQDRAVEAHEREEQIRAYAGVMEGIRRRLEQDTWRVAEALECEPLESYPRGDLTSIKRFIEKLGVHEVLSAVDITLAKDDLNYRYMFRYFCGVCWGKIREQQETE